MEPSANTSTATAPRPRFTGCCPPFEPEPWRDAELRWHDKLFVKEHLRTVFHIPYAMGRTVTRAMAKINAAGAESAQPLMLSDDVSFWGANLYIQVTKDVP